MDLDQQLRKRLGFKPPSVASTDLDHRSFDDNRLYTAHETPIQPEKLDPFLSVDWFDDFARDLNLRPIMSSESSDSGSVFNDSGSLDSNLRAVTSPDQLEHACANPLTCAECLKPEFGHDPDLCLANRVAQRPQLVLDVTAWNQLEDAYGSQQQSPFTTTGFGFAYEEHVHFSEREVSTPHQNYCAAYEERIHRALANELKVARRIYDSWPQTPTDFDLFKYAERNVDRAVLETKTKSIPKQRLIHTYCVYAEARTLFRSFLNHVKRIGDNVVPVRLKESASTIPRKEWGGEIVGISIYGKSQNFLDILSLRTIVFSKDVSDIAKAKIELSSRIDESMLNTAMKNPLDTFNNWLLRPGLSRDEVAHIMYCYTPEGRKRGAATCPTCDTGLIKEGGKWCHERSCPVSRYLDERWQYRARRHVSTGTELLQRVAHLRHSTPVKERTGTQKERVLSFEAGKIGRVFNTAERPAPKQADSREGYDLRNTSFPGW